MSNVIEFKRERWCAGPVECFQCKHEWVGVWPEGLLHLYCPECDGPYGLPLDEQAPAEPETEEPVGWINTNSAVNNKLKQKPISLHPPRPEPAIRKPMTEEEIKAEIKRRGYDLYEGAIFLYGIRFAESTTG